MLEPYQPKFQQQHRSSCPLVELEPIPTHNPSFSRASMGMSMPTGRIGSISGPASSHYTVRGNSIYDTEWSFPCENQKFSFVVKIHQFKSNVFDICDRFSKPSISNIFFYFFCFITTNSTADVQPESTKFGVRWNSMRYTKTVTQISISC